MEWYNVVLNCVGLIIIALGMICIYDARKLVIKFFSASDINGTIKTVKIVGFMVSLLGAVIILV